MTTFVVVALPWLIVARLTWRLRAQRREHDRQLTAVRQDAAHTVAAYRHERARNRSLHAGLRRALAFGARQYEQARTARWQAIR